MCVEVCFGDGDGTWGVGDDSQGRGIVSGGVGKGGEEGQMLCMKVSSATMGLGDDGEVGEGGSVVGGVECRGFLIRLLIRRTLTEKFLLRVRDVRLGLGDGGLGAPPWGASGSGAAGICCDVGGLVRGPPRMGLGSV